MHRHFCTEIKGRINDKISVIVECCSRNVDWRQCVLLDDEIVRVQNDKGEKCYREAPGANVIDVN